MKRFSVKEISAGAFAPGQLTPAPASVGGETISTDDDQTCFGKYRSRAELNKLVHG